MAALPIANSFQPALAAPAVKSGDSPQKVKDAAQQFEGLLLAQVLQQAHQEGGWLDSGDPAGSAATGFAEQQLAAAIAHNGGLGLAAIIASGLERRESGPSEAPPCRP